MSLMVGLKPNKSLVAIRLDQVSDAQVHIDNNHNNIHRGMHYRAVCPVHDLQAGGILRAVFDIPTIAEKSAHMLFNFYSSGEYQIRILEDVTSYTGGTAIVPMNNRRVQPKVSAATVLYGHNDLTPIVPTGGTLLLPAIYIGQSGHGSNAPIGGENRNEDEIILATGTTYMFEIMSLELSDTSNAYMLFDWYEYPPFDLA